MSRRLLAFPLASALLAAGCSLAPRYERPSPPVAAAWPGGEPAAAAPAGAPATASRGWRAVFTDPRLQGLISLALANNRDLRIAMLNVELARAQYGIDRAPRVPSLGASASGARAHLGEDVTPPGVPATTATTWSVGLAVTGFELDFFGRVRSLSDAALEQFLASEEARRTAHLSLVAEVATQYLTLRAYDDQVALARRTLEAVESSAALARRTFEAGRTSELDVRTAEAQLHTARFNLSSAALQRDRAQNALVLLVGQPLPADLPPPRPLEAQALVADLPAGLPSELLLRRPDLLAAEHQLQAANAVIGAARAAFFPSISLTGTGGFSGPDLAGLFAGGAGLWSFVPQLRLPIFQGGALRASLDAARVRKELHVARYERAIQVAYREVADALVSRAALEEQLEAQQARVAAETRRSELSELRYAKGVDSYLGVLQAQKDLFAAQQLLIQSRLARVTNLVSLYRALGGGWIEGEPPRDVP
jgi:multidrug efflux system outer membrane protein